MRARLAGSAVNTTANTPRIASDRGEPVFTGLGLFVPKPTRDVAYHYSYSA